MKTRAIAVLSLIVIIPLVLLGWMGLRVLSDEQQLHDHQVQTLIVSQLKAVDTSIGHFFKKLETDLPARIKNRSLDPESVRGFIRETPDVRQVLIFDEGYRRVFPPGGAPLTDRERQFLERAGAMSTRREPVSSGSEEKAVQLVFDPRNITPSPQVLLSDASKQSGDDRPDLEGWHVWFAGTEMNHLFWWRDNDRHLIGFELDPVRLQASIIAFLPDTGGAEDRLGDARIRLVDSQGTVVYQWGRFEPGEGQAPVRQLLLSPPLGSWKLEYFGSGLGTGTGLKWFNIAGALTVVGAALFGLAFYLYRDHVREMKLAEQRVNFVNQVSHELKTPLTNIRLYAELLDDNLPEKVGLSEEEGRFRHYLDVITSESRRLSRLIGNVLNFARSRKDRLILRREAGNVDEIINSTLNIFAPSLEANGVRIHFQAAAADPVEVDADALEQILNNIFSNTEKYGASGGRLDIKSGRRADRTFITVRDYGPGIPRRETQRIFLPFYRISSRLTDGVTGTGIGLAIARDLARLHGGDLTLLSSDQGACFKIELCTPIIKGDV